MYVVAVIIYLVNYYFTHYINTVNIKTFLQNVASKGEELV